MKSQKSVYYIAIIALVFPVFILAETRSSSSYIIQSDSINLGGGYSTSSNYNLESTAGESATGQGSSSSYNLSAGYQALTTNYLAISNSSNVTLPSIGGVSGGNSTGQSTWTVTTDDLAGYQVSISATSTPALKSGAASVADYVPSGAAPDYNFTYASNVSVFGFSPEGSDIVQKYKNNVAGTACNTGALDTADKCWNGFSTTPEVIAQSSSSNHPAGTNTTVKYQVGIGSAKIQDAGTYQASIVVTALAL